MGVKSIGPRNLLAVWKKNKYLWISDVANGKVTGKKKHFRVLVIVISCLSGEKLERVWVGRISLERVQVEHGRQGRAGSAGLARVILGFLSF